MLKDYGLIVVCFTNTMGVSQLKIINASQSVDQSVRAETKRLKLWAHNSEERPSVTKGIGVLRASE